MTQRIFGHIIITVRGDQRPIFASSSERVSSEFLYLMRRSFLYYECNSLTVVKISKK